MVQTVKRSEAVLTLSEYKHFQSNLRLAFSTNKVLVQVIVPDVELISNLLKDFLLKINSSRTKKLFGLLTRIGMG